MITNPATLTGTILSNGTPRRLRGKGVVEAKLDSKTYVLSVGNEKLRVELEEGELRPGDRVLISQKGDTVILRKIPRETQRDLIQVARIPIAAPESPRDMQKLTAVLRHVAAIESPPAAPDQFRDLESALIHLSRSTQGSLSMLARETAEHLREFIADGSSEKWLFTREALARLAAVLGQYTQITGSAQFPEIGATPHESTLLPGLESLPKEVVLILKSALLRNVPIQTSTLNLLDIVKNGNFVSVDRLKELFSTGIMEQVSLGTDGPAESDKFGQWLSLVVNTDASLPLLIERIPQFRETAPDLAHYIREANLNTGIATNSTFSSPTPGTDTVSRIPPDLVQNTVSFLGLDTENRFSTMSARDKLPENLKTHLLQTLFEHTVSSEGNPVSATTAPKTESPFSASLLNMFSQWNRLHGNLIETLESTFTPQQGTMSQERATREGLANELRATFARTDQELKGVFQALMSGRLPSDQATRVLARLITALSDHIGRMLTDLTENTSESFRNAGPSSPTDSKTVPAGLFSEIDAKVRNLSKEVAILTGTQESSHVLHSTVRNIETALSRLETLQLLARPTPTADGTQQVITIPMQADGEWKDVTIKLLKRDGKEGKKDGSYSVRVHIAPGFLGNVSAHLEFDRNRDLVVNIACERNTAAAWLSAHKDDITEGLRTLGFRSVRTAVGAFEPHSHGPDCPADAPPNENPGTGIDLRI